VAVEGTVNRIKQLKAAMYGRAKPDLLRKLILLAWTQPDPRPAPTRWNAPLGRDEFWSKHRAVCTSANGPQDHIHASITESAPEPDNSTIHSLRESRAW